MTQIILKNTVWKTGDFINLTDSIEIAPNVTLTIENGVTVNGNGNTITNYGTLIASGNNSKNTIFANISIRSGDTWSEYLKGEGQVFKFNNIEFNKSSIQINYIKSISLSNSRFDYSSLSITDSALEYSIVGNTFLESNLSVGSAFTNSFENIHIENNLFINSNKNNFSSLWIGSTRNVLITVEKNTFLTSGGFAIALSREYISSILAKDNYFGTNDTEAINSMLLDRNDSLAYPSYISNSHTEFPDPFTPKQSDPPYLLEFGTYSNDVIYYVNMSNHFVNGLDGLDFVRYTVNKSNIKIIKNHDESFSVIDLNTLVSDNLKNIERIQFFYSYKDTTIALDLKGNAGIVVKIIGAVFGKSSVANKDYVGIGLDLIDKGMSYETLAGIALNVAKAVTSDEIVTTLWRNVVGASPNESDKAPYIKLLSEGMTPGQLTQLAADTTMNAVNVNLIGLTQTGIEYNSLTAYH